MRKANVSPQWESGRVDPRDRYVGGAHKSVMYEESILVISCDLALVVDAGRVRLKCVKWEDPNVGLTKYSRLKDKST
jgi:hypothetical protein